MVGTCYHTHCCCSGEEAARVDGAAWSSAGCETCEYPLGPSSGSTPGLLYTASASACALVRLLHQTFSDSACMQHLHEFWPWILVHLTYLKKELGLLVHRYQGKQDRSQSSMYTHRDIITMCMHALRKFYCICLGHQKITLNQSITRNPTPTL